MDIERDPAELKRAFLQVGSVLIGVYLLMWAVSSLLGLMPGGGFAG